MDNFIMPCPMCMGKIELEKHGVHYHSGNNVGESILAICSNCGWRHTFYEILDMRPALRNTPWVTVFSDGTKIQDKFTPRVHSAAMDIINSYILSISAFF